MAANFARLDPPSINENLLAGSAVARHLQRKLVLPVKTFQSFCNTLLPTPNASALSFCTCKGRSGLQQAANWLDAKPNARLLCNPSPARSREHLQCEKHLKNESKSWSYSLCVCLDFSLLKTGTVPHQSDSSIAHHPPIFLSLMQG